MSSEYDVVAIGNAIVDVVRRCDDTFLASIGTEKGHMRLVESSASIAELCKRLPGGIDVAGGSAANTAVGVASFGGKAAFIGRTAEDQYGRIFRHDLRGAGVQFEAEATAIPGKETSHALILVTPDGRRTMNSFLGCSPEVNEASIDVNLIRAAKFVYLEGYLLDSASAVRALASAAAMASAAGRGVALSLSDPECVMRNRSAYIQVMSSGVGIVIANEQELCALYQSDFEAAAGQIAKDVGTAVLTLSEKGSLIIHKGTRIKVQPECVRKVIDATGAGDLYASGFLYGLARNLDLEAAGRLASFAASEIICQLGARPQARLGHLARIRGLIN